MSADSDQACDPVLDQMFRDGKSRQEIRLYIRRKPITTPIVRIEGYWDGDSRKPKPCRGQFSGGRDRWTSYQNWVQKGHNKWAREMELEQMTKLSKLGLPMIKKKRSRTTRKKKGSRCDKRQRSVRRV